MACADAAMSVDWGGERRGLVARRAGRAEETRRRRRCGARWVVIDEVVVDVCFMDV